MSTAGMTTRETNDFMAMESELVQRIQAAVADQKPAVHVLTSADLADVREELQKVPAVHVIYGGYRVVEAQGAKWRLAHKWLIVAAVRNVAQGQSGSAARREAGQLSALATAAVAGESLPGATRASALVTPPPARYSKGFQYLPSALEVETIFAKPQP